jgi:DNA-binding IclR family transcriptional regulator
VPRTNAAPRVSVTSRVLSILGCFDAGHRSLTLTEVARRAGLTLPTAHRLVGELADWGALRRTSHGRYVVGRRLWDLGLLAPVQTDLRNVAAPFLQDLYGATLATVHFAVRDGALALYLDRVSGHASVPVVSKVGGTRSSPLPCSVSRRTRLSSQAVLRASSSAWRRTVTPPRPRR